MSFINAFTNIGRWIAGNPTLVSTAANIGSTLLNNQANRNQSLQMYNNQRQDALADWNRQNMYNNPKETMARFKEAGLNPHLIYGQTNNAAPVRSSDYKASTNVAPEIPNIAKIALEMGLLNAQTAQTQALTEQKKVDTALAKETFDYKVGQESWKTNLLQNQNLNTQMRTHVMSSKLKPEINSILANTNLSVERKAAVSQQITNLISANNLLGERILTEKQQNEFVQQVDAVSKVGGLGVKLLSLLFNR